MTQPTPKQFVEAALDLAGDSLGHDNVERVETEDENIVSRGTGGAWVEVWVWVPEELALRQSQIDDDGELVTQY